MPAFCYNEDVIRGYLTIGKLEYDRKDKEGTGVRGPNYPL